ncbi:hypothetical protein [Colwellia sp. 20A7]|uniref:hypothetical protein n=1 Tax=Colwellia sp. 20A7 TaxID=2689569 RepID=UPI00135A38AD|nr:hypothetical protein [Colwellia sp. 20A7]
MFKKEGFSKANLWAVLLLVLSFCYLLFELAFNSRIVDGASGSFDALMLEALEYQGRILSGIGITLLLLRLITPGKTKAFTQKVLLLSFFGFTLMFFGQKVLIDTLVNNSSESDRVDAMHIALLKKGISTNTIQIDDMEVPADQVDTPATKAMLSIVGAMVFNSESFISHLKSSVHNIIDQVSELDARKTFPKAYDGYKEYQENVIKGWADYAAGVNEYNSAKKKVHINAIYKTDEIYLAAANEFTSKQAKLSKQERIRKSLEIKRAVSDYFEAKDKADKKCTGHYVTNEKCHIKIEQAYRDTVLKQAGRYVAPDHWCYPPEKKRMTETIRGRSRSVVKTVTDCHSMSRDYIEDKMMALMSGGETLSFLDNIKVADAVRNEISKEGVQLPLTWTLREKDTLIEAIEQAGSIQIEQQYRESITFNVGKYLPPTLTQKQFVNHSVIQSPLKEQLQWNKSMNIPLDLSPEVFLQIIHKPKYIEVYLEQKQELEKDGQYFGDGEQLEERGKSYYRSIVVPPLAMGFSLFFGLLNLMALIRVLMSTKIRKPIYAQLSATTLMVVIFVVIPFTFPSETVKSKAFKYFDAQLSNDYHAALGKLSAWVVDTQPMVYPIGHAITGLVKQAEVEETLKAYLYEPPIHGKSVVVENDEEEDFLSSEETFETNEKENSAIDQQELPNDTERSSEIVAPETPLAEITFSRQSESDGKAHAYSKQLVKNAFENMQGVMFDISPIGVPSDEKWVIYDKPNFNDDICIPGRREYDTLRNITVSQWRAGFHGTCKAGNGMLERLPSLASYLRNIKQNRTAPLIVSLQEDIAGEVFCNRYVSLIEDVTNQIGNNNIIFSTPSISVLGCFNKLSSQYMTAFEMPLFSDSPTALKAKNHLWMTRAEWGRLKHAEKGGKPTLNRVDISDLNTLIEHHPFLDALLVDTYLYNDSVDRTLKKHNKIPFLMSGNLIKGQLLQ